MTDRPAIFSRDMVVALRAKRKTQTRRLATSPLRLVIPGDRLWVRERFCRGAGDETRYEADGVDPFDTWSVAFLMPRGLSRITLLVTEVRLQHAHDITAEDVLAEGVTVPARYEEPMLGLSLPPAQVSPAMYGELWDKLHGAGQWHLNPPVVALTFTVALCNIDRL